MVFTNQTIQYHTSADNNLNLYCLKNLKFCIIFLLQIDYGHPSQPNFPRSTGNWWFHCDEEGAKEDETSPAPSTSTVATDTTAIPTTVSNITVTDENVTSTTPITTPMDNGTTAIPTTVSNITVTDANVTSILPTTSTIEETPPPSGRELDHDMDYITHTGIHCNQCRVVLKCDMLKDWMLLLASAFWDVRPPIVVVRYWYIQWTCCLPFPDWSWYGTIFHLINCNTHTLRT